MKYRLHSTEGMASSTPTSSDSVELLVLHFCLHKLLMTVIVPSVMAAPVCPLQSQCTPWAVLICQIKLVRLPTGSLSFRRDLCGFHLDLVLLQGDRLGLGLAGL